MKRILVIEWTCLQGLDSNLHEQGLAMLSAVCEDFIRSGHRVSTVVHQDLNEFLDRRIHLVNVEPQPPNDELAYYLPDGLITRIAEESDQILLVAPEFESQLAALTNCFSDQEHKLLSPNLAFVELCSSKTKTCQWLRRHQVCVPADFMLRNQSAVAEWMVKPDDGAGGSQMVRTSDPSVAILQTQSTSRAEEFIPGIPISVSVICRSENLFLPPCHQVLSNGNYGEYLDGCLVEDERLIGMATELAEKTVDALPDANGWIGIDMVLPSHDRIESQPGCVIEVNPRLTSSYLVLREKLDMNLATAMLRR